MNRWLQATLFIFCLQSVQVVGATLINVNVEQHGDNYKLHVEARINAKINDVKRIITDYENLPSINPYLKKSKITSTSKDSQTTVSMLTEACVLFICFKIKHEQVFQLIGTDIVYGQIIPELSDFKKGWTRWTIKEDSVTDMKQAQTLVILDGEMTPDFFILPIIGPYHLKKKILEIATITINNLEKKAQ